jgi:hypothetical protein
VLDPVAQAGGTQTIVLPGRTKELQGGIAAIF